MNRNEIKKKLIERDGLRCAVTGEEFDDHRALNVEHIKPRSIDSDPNDLDNLILVSKSVNASIANDDNFRTKLLIEQLEKRQKEINLREKDAFERENSYRKEIEKQRHELDKFKKQLEQQQYEKEHLLSKEIEERRRDYMLQEKRLHEQTEVIVKKNNEFEKQRQEIALQFEALEKEKEKYREETRKQIEKKSNKYVTDALTVLETKEKKYHIISNCWSILGAVSILFGIILLVVLGVKGFNILEAKVAVEWSFLFLVSFKGIIVLGLFIALAKYSFTFSQSYMHESLKSSERIHAINFGKFYLESYGADADWAQIKEAFEHWNISSNTAFSSNKADSFDPKIFEGAANLIEAVGKVYPKESNSPQKSTSGV
mgnify:CR=1 FL=1